MHYSAKWRIEILGHWGFSARCIVREVLKHDGEKFSTATVYRVLKKAKIRIKSHRDGLTKNSKSILEGAGSRFKTSKLADHKKSRQRKAG